MIAARAIATADKAARAAPFQVANTLDGLNDDTVILTDQAQAELIFTADITNVSLFNADFVIAHSYLLAWMLGMAVAGKRELAGQALQAFNQFLRAGMAADARESVPIPTPDAPWIGAWA